MELTHFNESGRARIVDVSEKIETKRIAIASAEIFVNNHVLTCIKEGTNKKGDVLQVAQVAGIMGAKKTSEVIPMCHSIFLTGIDIEFEILKASIKIYATAKTTGKTGVEMEALSAVSIAALTIYDMCKAIDKSMIISNIRLEQKSGGNQVNIGEKNMENKTGKILAINLSEKKGTVKHSVEVGEFQVDHGLVGDAHAGNWHRQVSLLGTESVEKMKEKGIEGLCNGIFAENLTTEGICLYELPIGTKLKIGETVQEVTQIGKECHKGCEIQQQVGECVMPKEGIFTKILVAGKIKANDIIEVI